MTGASAPGKLVISGEYVVLEGAWALVAAVDRRAVARFTAGSAPGFDRSGDRPSGSPDRAGLPPEAAAASRMAEEVCGSVPHELSLDVHALREAGRKLGLGSSAAGAVAAAGAVFAWHGHDLEAPKTRRQILDAALAGHRAVAPEGSGIDVAASVTGGLIRFRRDGEAVEVDRVAMPRRIVLRVIWTSTEARTSDYLTAVRALGERDPGSHARLLGALREASDVLIDAVESDDPESAVAATEAHARAMDELGRAAGVPIVDERLERIAQIARAAGGAAKPSGAGGGDVALAVLPPGADLPDLERAWTDAGMHVLDLGLGADGVMNVG